MTHQNNMVIMNNLVSGSVCPDQAVDLAAAFRSRTYDARMAWQHYCAKPSETINPTAGTSMKPCATKWTSTLSKALPVFTRRIGKSST